MHLYGWSMWITMVFCKGEAHKIAIAMVLGLLRSPWYHHLGFGESTKNHMIQKPRWWNQRFFELVCSFQYPHYITLYKYIEIEIDIQYPWTNSVSSHVLLIPSLAPWYQGHCWCIWHLVGHGWTRETQARVSSPYLKNARWPWISPEYIYIYI